MKNDNRQGGDNTPLSPNRIFKLVRLSHQLAEKDTVEICVAGGLKISRSRAKGWAYSPEHRKYYRMNWGELEAFLEGLCIWIEEEGDKDDV